MSAMLASWAATPAIAIAAIFLLGGFGFAVNPALNARVFSLAGDAPTLATAVNFSSFNVGITIGPWIGGVAIDAGAGYQTLGWLAVALGLAALGTVVLASLLPLRPVDQSRPVNTRVVPTGRRTDLA
jgi:DHA1 family chloramphenicol resistance protein-like MFS transporter